MGLSAALSLALSGLDASQRSMTLTAANVANADTPGYSRKIIDQQALVGDGRVLGVDATRIQRTLNEVVQTELRSESAQTGYLQRVSSYQTRLDELFGAPGDANALDTQFNAFVSALEGLSTTPEGYVERAGVLNSAQVLAGKLNAMSADVQTMRRENEFFLRDAVDDINQALAGVKELNDQVIAGANSARGISDLEDQRDIFIDRLAQYMDVNVEKDTLGAVTIATTGGVQLFDGVPVRLSFDARSTLTPETSYSTDAAERGVGTITISAANGLSIDLLQKGAVRGGLVGAARDLRDDVLVEAQAQLDQLAAGLATSLGTYTEAGQPVSIGQQEGFTLDVAELKAGNRITLTSQPTGGGAESTISFVRVDDPSLLPLDNSVTASPDDRVVGLDFSNGLPSVALQMQQALGISFTVSATSATQLRVLDDGVVNAVEITDFSAGISASQLADEAVALPMFQDVGGAVYSGFLEGTGQQTGFAGRITVNNTLLDNPDRLALYETSPQTLAGDATRPDFLLAQLTETRRDFAAAGGLGTADSPFSGTVSSLFSEVINNRGAQAEAAQGQFTSQQGVQTAIEARFSEGAEVSIDEEMSRLVELQTAYAANARVMQVVQEMLDSLLRV